MHNINNRQSAKLWLSGLSGLLIFFLSGCLDVIDIETPSNNLESVVIQGKLVVGSPSHVNVKLSKLFQFVADGKQPVNARNVLLLDENNNGIELEDQGLGSYALTIPANSPDFQVELGTPYKIQVNTFDGRTFESSMEIGEAVPKPESINYRLIQREALDAIGNVRSQEFLQYNVNTPLKSTDANNNVRLGWEYQYTYKVNDTPFQFGINQKICYITQNLNISDVTVVDASELASDRLDDYTLYETRVSRNYGEGAYFTAIQESLSETAYNYFRQVAENTGRTGNMFEAPPGKVISNIANIADETDETFGFFYVTQQDTIRTFVDPELIGAPPNYCPPPNGLTREDGSCADPICCDCSSVPNSTTEIPDFWEE